jgi:ornithine carbamoyltransferase
MALPKLGLRGRSLQSLRDFTAAEIGGLLDLSSALKAASKAGRAERTLIGRSLAMIFQKRSTRTRVSTETAMTNLGGHALFLSNDDIQLGQSESLKDTSRVLSRFNDCILARVGPHSDIVELDAESSVPVINALSDMYHPLQGLADMLTMREHFGSLEGRTLAWVGDGNNVLHSLMIGCAKMGMHLRVATPQGFEADAEITALTESLAAESGASLLLTEDPAEAMHASNVIVTDTWISMGQEAEKAERLRQFEGYEITKKAIADAGASEDWIFLHCLPRYPYEVDDEVFYDEKRSLVWDEAENRMWTVGAVLHAFLADEE